MRLIDIFFFFFFFVSFVLRLDTFDSYISTTSIRFYVTQVIVALNLFFYLLLSFSSSVRQLGNPFLNSSRHHVIITHFLRWLNASVFLPVMFVHLICYVLFASIQRNIPSHIKNSIFIYNTEVSPEYGYSFAPTDCKIVLNSSLLAEHFAMCWTIVCVNTAWLRLLLIISAVYVLRELT